MSRLDGAGTEESQMIQMKAFLDKSSNPNALTNPGSKKKAWLA